MTVRDIYKLINHDEVFYVNFIDNKTKEEFANLGDDYILGGYKEDYLMELEVTSIGIEEDSTNINLYVKREDD